MKKNKWTIGTVLTFSILVIFLIIFIYPLIWLFINSFKDNTEIFVNPWGLPSSWSIVNYIRAFQIGNVGIYFINSVFITMVSVTIGVMLSCMASYGITRIKWKMSNFVYLLFVLGISIPPFAAIVPLFAMFNWLKILNTYAAIILVHIVFSFPISIFILSGFFSTIPRELEEAAIIDGCTKLGTFFKIILPISTNSIVLVMIISFLRVWNDLLFAQIFLSSENMMPITVGLLTFKDAYSTDYTGMIATALMVITPAIIMYVFLQKKITEGVTLGAVKG